MTGFRRGHQDDEDLLVLARRQSLGDTERSELAALLDADPTLRIAHDAGRAFDDVAFVRPGDEALIARVVDRTVAARRRGTVAARWRVRIAAAAAMVLVAGAAAAYWAGIVPGFHRAPAVRGPDRVRPAPPSRHPETAPAVAAAAPAVAPSGAPVASTPGRVDPGAAREALAEARPPRAPRPLRKLPSSPTPPPRLATAPVGAATPGPEARPPAPTKPAPPASAARSTDSAAELFRRASAARRSDALADACALYRELQARFPAAEEARLSHVSLGKLLLAMGQPAEAERHFTLYLAGGAGALAAEAAFGRAQSFERMARAREELHAWGALLRDFPGSIYAGAARRRIAVLEASGAAAPAGPGAAPAGAPGTVR